MENKTFLVGRNLSISVVGLSKLVSESPYGKKVKIARFSTAAVKFRFLKPIVTRGNVYPNRTL